MTPCLGSGDISMEESDRVKPILFCVHICGRKEGDGARWVAVGGAWPGYRYVSLM